MNPEDVKPRQIGIEWNDGTRCDNFIPAAEAAQIARAYAEDYSKYQGAVNAANSSSLEYYPAAKKTAEEHANLLKAQVEAWEKLFAEWQA